ncbi:MAG: chromosome segregation protein SMC, partial [Lachnospiraceae bacterium]|nr:chromosome segregation protein SMC [Lachnospiraceae bacterium]
MYLKSIEIQGFKSFANKMRFEFHNGITAIVGPNGSGKSNVADAVRWVLGEQRVKQLRGASMQDVIFAGTQERKPQSYAYVAITLDNSDHALAAPYEEVTVARRIYRSGESEYLLNGSACRLKDVNELFYDTGIGKEGYSIIGQGQIERILSDKPEDRRQLFDEAAGIVKFKRRKEASVKKLEDERANMVRIGDILSELEKQVGPLEEQAKKAHAYLEAREKLKVLDVNVFLSENEELRAKIRDLTQKASNAEEELETARTQFEQIRTEYDTVQNGIENLDKEIEETRNKITNTDIVRGRLEGDIKVYEEQIRAAQSNVAHFTGRKDSVAELLKAQEDERARIGGEKEKIDAQVEELRNQRSVQNAQLEEIVGRIRELTESSDRARETILDILNKRAQIKSKQASLETLSQETQIRQAELTSRLVGIQSDENRQNDVIRELEETFAKITQEITSLQETKDGIEADIAGKKQALSDSDARLREVQQSYHQDQSKLEALRNLTERYEGFGGSVRKVMEHKKSEKGLIGVVADLIKTDKKYETAIEVALGGNIQNVVTEDEDTAKRMIEMLKREKGGRATFLPLTRTNDPQEFKTPEVLDEEGVIGLADSIVETDAKYRNIAKTLLGRIVVVDSFDNAVRIGRRHSAAIRMVTVEGEMFAPGGAITGGTFKNSSNLLGS